MQKKEENRAWDMWLTLYPKMNSETFIPFNEFYKKHTEPTKSESKEEILLKVFDIIKTINTK